MSAETVAAGPLSVADAARLRDHAQAANLAIKTARTLLTLHIPTDANGKTPDDLLFEAQELTEHAHTALYRAVGPSTGVVLGPLSLADLGGLDTGDTRELLALLEQAQAVAQRVDVSRGRALPPDTVLQQGEALGTDLSEAVSEIALRVRREVNGASGRE